MAQRSKGLIMVSTGAAMWGASGVAGQYLLQACGFATGWLVVTRMLLAGLILLLLDALLYRQSLIAIWQDAKDARETLAFAVFGMLAVQYSYFASIRHGNAAAATVLQYLMPVLIIGWTAAVTRKRPRYIDLACVALAVTGTFFLVTHGSLEALSIPLPALLYGLASAAAAAFYTMQPKRLIRKWRATLVIGWGMLLGGLVLSVFCPPWQFAGTWSPTAALTYAYIILFGTVIAFGCYLGSIKYIQPAEASILGSLEPLAAILFSCLLLGAHFGAMDILGTALILATVFLLARK